MLVVTVRTRRAAAARSARWCRRLPAKQLGALPAQTRVVVGRSFCGSARRRRFVVLVAVGSAYHWMYRTSVTSSKTAALGGPGLIASVLQPLAKGAFRPRERIASQLSCPSFRTVKGPHFKAGRAATSGLRIGRRVRTSFQPGQSPEIGCRRLFYSTSVSAARKHKRAWRLVSRTYRRSCRCA